MHKIPIENIKTIRKIRQRRKSLEKKLKVKIEIKNKQVTLTGNEIAEYEAIQILKALDKGFNLETALLLLDENFVFEQINIKDLSKRTNISQIRARIIGRKGQTLKVLQELTESSIILHDNQVYIISPVEKIKDVLNGLKKLILGAKQSSTYSYLERARKNPQPIDLGLKIKKK